MDVLVSLIVTNGVFCCMFSQARSTLPEAEIGKIRDKNTAHRVEVNYLVVLDCLIETSDVVSCLYEQARSNLSESEIESIRLKNLARSRAV